MSLNTITECKVNRPLHLKIFHISMLLISLGWVYLLGVLENQFASAIHLYDFFYGGLDGFLVAARFAWLPLFFTFCAAFFLFRTLKSMRPLWYANTDGITIIRGLLARSIHIPWDNVKSLQIETAPKPSQIHVTVFPRNVDIVKLQTGPVRRIELDETEGLALVRHNTPIRSHKFLISFIGFLKTQGFLGKLKVDEQVKTNISSLLHTPPQAEAKAA